MQPHNQLTNQQQRCTASAQSNKKNNSNLILLKLSLECAVLTLGNFMSTWQHAPVDLPQDNLQRPTDGQMVAQQLHGALYNPFNLPMPPPAAGRGPWPVDWPEGRNNCIAKVKLVSRNPCQTTHRLDVNAHPHGRFSPCK